MKSSKAAEPTKKYDIPPTLFSPDQLRARKLSLKLTKNLIKRQKTNGQFVDKSGVAANFVQQAILIDSMMLFVSRQGMNNNTYSQINTVPMVEAACRGAAYLVKSIKAKGKYEFVKTNEGNTEDNTAILLNTLATIVTYQFKEKWRPASPFHVTKEKRFFKHCEKLALYLFKLLRKLAKPNKIKTPNVALILQALLNWNDACRLGFAYNPELKTRQFKTYESRKKLYDLLFKFTDENKTVDYLRPVMQILRNPYELEPAKSGHLFSLQDKFIHDDKVDFTDLIWAWVVYGNIFAVHYVREMVFVYDKINKPMQKLLAKPPGKIANIAKQLPRYIFYAQFPAFSSIVAEQANQKKIAETPPEPKPTKKKVVAKPKKVKVDD